MEIIVLMPNVPVPPPPIPLQTVYTNYSLKQEGQKVFDLVPFEDTQIESRAVSGDISARGGGQDTGWQRAGAVGALGFSRAGSVDVQEMEQCFCGLCRRCP